jgi:short-subunit dehydrogenase
MRAIAISGASRGLGAALALGLAGPGVRLWLSARGAAGLQATALACRARGAEVTVCVADVRDAAALAVSLGAFAAAGPVHLAIANAGASAGTRPDGASEDAADARQMIEVNLIGAINLAGPLLPALLAARGQVAIIGSVAGWRGLPDMPAYCAAKAGLRAWAQGLRAAHGPAGLSVTLVAPGFFESAMGDRFQGPRPFLISLEQAAARTLAAIAARRAEAMFPWPMALTMRALAALPPRLGDAAARRLRFAIAPEA